MAVSLRAADLPISIDVGDRNLRIEFTDGRDLSGTWTMNVRSAVTSATVVLSPTVDTSQALSGIITVPFDANDLDAVVPATETSWKGVYAIAQNDQPLFAGTFVLNRTAFRP